MFEKHLWKSDILSKDAGRIRINHCFSKKTLPGLSISGTFVENGLFFKKMLWSQHSVTTLMAEIFAVLIFAIFANFGQIRENESCEVLQIQVFAKTNLAKFRKKNFCSWILTSFDLKKDIFNEKYLSQKFAKIYLTSFFPFDHSRKFAMISSFAKANPINFTSPWPREI